MAESPHWSMVLDLSSEVHRMRRAAAQVGHPVEIRPLRPMRLVLAGPIDGGKTTFVRALLGPAAQFSALTPRPGRDSMVVVEYGYGEAAGLKLGLGGTTASPGQWVHAAIGASLSDYPTLTRVRAAVPAPLLAELDLTIVDVPSIDGIEDLYSDRHADLHADDVCLLYLVPSRGISETDKSALELLRRGSPVVVVENLRETDLDINRGRIEVGLTPHLTCPTSVPLVITRLDPVGRNDSGEDGGAERKLVRRVLSALRRADLSRAELNELRDGSRAEAERMRAAHSPRLAAIDRRPAGDPVEALQALADLFALGDDLARLAPVDEQLIRLSHQADQLLTLTDQAVVGNLLAEEARLASDQYAVQMATRRPIIWSTDDPSRPTGAARVTADAAPADVAGAPIDDAGFAAGYGRIRKNLQNLLANLHDDRDLALTAAEAGILQRLADDVDRDRIELAMLGKFSSGKSSIVNSLMGTKKFLPAKPRPTTATINQVGYGEHTRLREVAWLRRASLSFLRDDDVRGREPGRMRLHRDEVRAFHRWVTSGQVRRGDFRIGFLEPPGEVPSSAGRDGWDDFLRFFDVFSRDLDRASDGYVYLPEDEHRGGVIGGVADALSRWDLTGRGRGDREARSQRTYLPRMRLPTAVKVKRFSEPPADWPGSRSVEDVFDDISNDPALALRIDELRVEFPHPLLRQCVITDTPGTDAPVPHHQEMAIRLVRDKVNSVIIYCFNGAQPVSMADEENFRLLKDARSSENLARFFFVITFKASVSPHERPEARNRVVEMLREAGFAKPTVYFVEAVQSDGPDPELTQMRDDLKRFVAQSKAPMMQGWIDGTDHLLASVADRHRTALEDMQRDEASRAKRLSELKAQAKVHTALSGELERSPEWGLDRLRTRVTGSVTARLEDLNELIDGLVTRRAFDNIASLLSTRLAALNDEASQATKTATTVTSNRLRSEAAQRLPGRQLIAVTSPQHDAFFPSAHLLQTARSLSWTEGAWNRVKGWFKRKFADGESDENANRRLLNKAWNDARKDGQSALDEYVAGLSERLRQALAAMGADIAAETASAARPPSPESLRQANAGAQKADKWRNIIGPVRDMAQKLIQ